MGDSEAALIAIGRALERLDYRFVTVTPESHRRVLERDCRPARTLRDVFGWSRTFDPEVIGAELFALLRSADAVEGTSEGGYRSRVRFSSLGGRLFVHSSFPTTAPNAVFFGPDTYRFCAAIARLSGRFRRVFDVGCGSGAGGIVVARRATEIALGDVNDEALAYARVNAALAGVRATVIRSDILAAAPAGLDLVLANPPYLLDGAERSYRHGGGAHGEGLALRILSEALPKLAPGGTLLLYTGAPIVDGVDVFRRAAEPMLREFRGAATYEELDPDVFGEELSTPAYATVDRIAAVVLTVKARHPGRRSRGSGEAD